MKSKTENPLLQKKLLDLFINELNNLDKDKAIDNLKARASISMDGTRIGQNPNENDKKNIKLFLDNPDNEKFSLEMRAEDFFNQKGSNITKKESVILDSLANNVTTPLIRKYDERIQKIMDEDNEGNEDEAQNLTKEKNSIQLISAQYRNSLANFFELDKNYKATSQTKEFVKNFGINLFDQDFEDFFKAFGKLKKSSKEHPETAQAVNNLLSAISRGIKDKDITKNDLQEITEYLNDTTNLIKNYSNESLEKHNDNIKKAIESNQPWGGKRPWGAIIGGALLCVSGILLVAAAVAVTVLTFGVSSPLTLPAAAVGGALTTAGIAIIAGAAAGLVITGGVGLGVASKAGIFAYNASKGTIADTMEEIRNSVEKTQNIKENLNSLKNKNKDEDEDEDEDEDKKIIDIS